MNIPEVNNEVRALRSENVTPAVKPQESPPQDMSFRKDAVQKTGKADADPQKEGSASREEVERQVQTVQEKLDARDIKLKFNVLEKEDTVQVEVQDEQGKVIRKIPADEMIKLSQSIKEFVGGFLDRTS
ncbi:flagellar protein FlaG [Pseudodesulfovibrio tunisiensis]|uniref:flagellar protein FlaG n=1 Tax=Pseudodesulfovibrio tunisiensis TaxID=463192 RepID=UPI001FB40D7A|nr:flagellar protein FlaG [Pseudodesulfovibrio tunisiensis]